jgi:phospholipid/cholesterol/gamma-HCH transport system substrate-binding protein
METSNKAFKVGVFVLMALTLFAILILNISKSAGPWTPQIRVTVESTEVGGLTTGAKVMMSGVPVGHVESIDLAADGRKVLVRCAILKRYRIFKDAQFFIQQSGFLGDQYLSIVPTKNEGAVLEDGSLVTAQPPFDLQEAARSAAGLLQRLDATAAKLDSAVTRVDRVLLAEGALRDLTNGFASFRRLSEGAELALVEVREVIRTNSPAVGVTLSNLTEFSASLRAVGTNVNGILDANKGVVELTLSNLAEASGDVKAFTSEVRSGQGLVGGLMRDEGMKVQAQQILGNFTVLSSNLSRFGILHKPKPVKAVATNRTVQAPRSPLR